MSQGIFVTDGYPMLFTLGDCSKYTEIREIVEAGGGELISKWTEGAIHLVYVEPGTPLPFPKPLDHPVYTYYFVIDSHNLEELQDLKRYELGVKATHSSGKIVRNRVKFTAMEEQAMREYMTKYPGSYTSVSYWAKARRYGLEAQRSADTLRDHCKRMIKGKFVREETPKRTPQSMKKQKTVEIQDSIDVIKPIPISPNPCLYQISPLHINTFPTTSITKSDSVHSSPNSPFSLSSRFEKFPSFLITVSKQGRVVQDIAELKRKCTEECIPDKFKWLVQRCQLRSIHPVEETEVLQVLMEMEGSVERTEAYFAQE